MTTPAAPAIATPANDNWRIIHGDCKGILASMATASVDAIVTDPPYGLSFMGKRWDYDVPPVEIWAECLRVLKPGGHMLSFAGTRTQHRMAVRIEDAGFEIRDMIAWVYGSGFPKSLDVSKAVDRMDAADEQERRRLAFTAWVRSQGVTARQIDDATCTNMGGHYTTSGSQPAIMTREHLDACRHLFRDVPEWVEREAGIRSVESKNMASREVIEERTMVQGGGTSLEIRMGQRREVRADVTAPATDAARRWQGWGTALKPALEPITVARKPLAGTVAENVMTHGTGAINVDGCRVGDTAGRWPANLIHDGSEEAIGLFPHTSSGTISPHHKRTTAGGNGNTMGKMDGVLGMSYGDAGSAARFFYCAKASKRDRGDGNNHPTVKPTDLMRYLCRLITPPGGLVLDPFAGSGSTGRGAVLEGFRFVGIEREAEYCEIARARIASAANDNTR